MRPSPRRSRLEICRGFDIGCIPLRTQAVLADAPVAGFFSKMGRGTWLRELLQLRMPSVNTLRNNIKHLNTLTGDCN